MSGKGAESLELYNQQQIQRLKAEFSNYHRHGELYITEASAISVNITTAGTYYTATGWTEGNESGTDHVVLNGTNGTITIGNKGAGVYQVFFGVSISANKVCTIHAHTFINGVVQENSAFIRTIGSASDYGAVSDMGLITLAAGDVVDLRFTSSANTTALTLDHGTLAVTWIAGA